MLIANNEVQAGPAMLCSKGWAVLRGGVLHGRTAFSDPYRWMVRVRLWGSQ